jgi:hypothetical protein
VQITAGRAQFRARLHSIYGSVQYIHCANVQTDRVLLNPFAHPALPGVSDKVG